MSPTSSGYNSDESPNQSPVQVIIEEIGSSNEHEIIPVQVQQAQIYPAQGMYKKIFQRDALRCCLPCSNKYQFRIYFL